MAYFLDERLHALTIAENTREKTYGEAPQSGGSKRTNKYAAPCVRCTGMVPKNEGILAKRGTKWEVTHETCP